MCWSLASEALAELPGLSRPWFALLQTGGKEGMGSVGLQLLGGVGWRSGVRFVSLCPERTSPWAHGPATWKVTSEPLGALGPCGCRVPVSAMTPGVGGQPHWVPAFAHSLAYASSSVVSDSGRARWLCFFLSCSSIISGACSSAQGGRGGGRVPRRFPAISWASRSLSSVARVPQTQCVWAHCPWRWGEP